MASYMAGFQAKGRVNSAIYAFASYVCSDDNPAQDVSNTEGIPGNPAGATVTPAIGAAFTSYIQGLDTLSATVRNATFDVLSNPFAAPFAIQANAYIALVIFVNGAAGVSWTAPSFYVEKAEINQDVRTLQPVSFSGRSDGSYTVPSA